MSSSATIPCVLVDQHHEVLPWLHLGIRRKAIAAQGLQVVHFDAHPDLGALRDAEVCWRPRDLVAYLDDSEYGISEWLLPLVYCNHVQRITWVKPDFAQQLPDGTLCIRVGKKVKHDRLAVDCDQAYFRDDGAYSTELENARDFRLEVVGKEIFEVEAPWILDICLDFFACQDPFNGQTDERRSQPLPTGGALSSIEDLDLTPLSDFLHRVQQSNLPPPQFISIARSATDGYTPEHIVDPLEARVLAVLRHNLNLDHIRRDLDSDNLGPQDNDELHFFPSSSFRSRTTTAAIPTATVITKKKLHLPPSPTKKRQKRIVET